MRVKNLTVKGFRGFNEKRSIDFHPDLTLIYAPNSYGKTSISESFEWLLYGCTSKVERAHYIEEYKGSYRNRHLPEGQTPHVKASFIDRTGNDIVFSGELLADECIKKFCNAQEVTQWPITTDITKAHKPFILQHALKYLLLVRPDERFQGFAHLLELDELDLLQRNVVSLCTKPDACIPTEVSQLDSEVSALEARLASQPSLKSIQKHFTKGAKGLEKAYTEIAAESHRRVPPGTDEESVLPQLLRIRDDAVAKIFKGNIKLPDYTQEEKRRNGKDEAYFLNSVADPFVTKYTGLIALASVQNIIERADFYTLGIKIFANDPVTCPFCGREIDESLSKHIHENHKKLLDKKNESKDLQIQKAEIEALLGSLKTKFDNYHTRHAEKTEQLIALEPKLYKLKTIFADKYETHFNAVKSAISKVITMKKSLDNAKERVNNSLDDIHQSIKNNDEKAKLITSLTDALTKYISEARSYAQSVLEKTPSMTEADSVLQHELNQLAGTEDISVLIDLKEQRNDIEKNFKIKGILAGLKDLRKTVDQYAATKVLEAISTDLTKEVMTWYGQIRTEGDPDVHFDGFDMERTREGKLKARRVKIKAKSYGKELVSAVSSLSESKLNALGLCVSIATNLKGESPFGFLIIDDSIQSWDAEHETQFIQVIRKLVEHGKQVILLSHNKKWINMVRSGCRSINGRYYEITMYTQAGPHIKEILWETWKERLKEVDGIIKDPTATSVKLQHAEEEVRIVIAQLASEIYLKKKNILKSPHDLNSEKIRKILLECGVETKLVDRITQTFETTDPAHHAPVDYETQRPRLQTYHAWAHELGKLVE